MSINVDAVVNEYYQFKTTTEDYLEFYNAFMGQFSMRMDELFQRLQWAKNRFERFVNGLLECGVIEIENGIVTIQMYDLNGVRKSVFDNFLMFQKLL